MLRHPSWPERGRGNRDRPERAGRRIHHAHANLVRIVADSDSVCERQTLAEHALSHALVEPERNDRVEALEQAIIREHLCDRDRDRSLPPIAGLLQIDAIGVHPHCD